ncbi:uncharacterized protein LOC128236041 [Mya arenaria]|uniref:uncharacterized protein LOC128236041 n=1 Tax=Mya arenaria TaxID=6604 RepID=UPI0022E10378|nr:uncharacterized protein LOC128236041 [Mya arenaria]
MLIWMFILWLGDNVKGTPPVSSHNEFGELTLFQPAFVGGNVTFRLTPSVPITAVTWQCLIPGNPVIQNFNTDEVAVRKVGETFLLVIKDVDKSLNGTYVFATFLHHENISLVAELNLREALGCGELNLLSDEPFVVGDVVRFGYFPSPEVIRGNYAMEMIKSTNLLKIPTPLNRLKLQLEGNEYKAVLLNVSMADSGVYRIQCVDGFSTNFSNPIMLIIEGVPVIGPLTSISSCRKCIVFKMGDTLRKLFCERNGSPDIAGVNFTIGSNVINSFNAYTLSPSKFGLDSHSKPNDSYHLMTAKCTFWILNRTLSAEATIYIVVPPEDPPKLQSTSVLKGETIDITCTSPVARPAPQLEIVVIGKPSTIVSTNLSIFDISKGLYRSIAKHSSPSSQWENKKLLCWQSAGDEGLYNSSHSNDLLIEYIYSPSGVYLSYSIPMRMREEMVVTCSAFTAHHVCTLHWEFEREDITFSVVSKEYVNKTYSESIAFNVSELDFKRSLYCSVKCSKMVLTNSTVLLFPQKPTVYIKETRPVPHYNIVYLNCLSVGYPDSNITWEMVDPLNGNTVEVLDMCDTPTCTLKIVSSSIDLVYNCVAQNEFGRANKTTRIVVSQENDGNIEDVASKHAFPVWIVATVVASVVFGFLVILLIYCCVKRRNRTGTAQVQHEDNQLQPPYTNSIIEGEENTYNEVDDERVAMQQLPSTYGSETGSEYIRHKRDTTSNQYDTIQETTYMSRNVSMSETPCPQLPKSPEGSSSQPRTSEDYLHVVYQPMSPVQGK